MKKIIILFAILISSIEIYAQKSFKVEKVIYQQKYDTFWSIITVKDIESSIGYNRDTLFVDFPAQEFFIAYANPKVNLYYENKKEITHLFSLAKSNDEECTIEFLWQNNELMKVIITECENRIEYIIKT